MKKSLAAIAILAFAITITLVYCSKRAGNQEKAVPLLQPLSVIKSIDPAAEYISGAIQISTNKKGDIAVLVNGKDTAHSTLFFIQGAHLNIVKTLEEGEVVYLLHSIIINSLDKKERYYFSVPKDEERLVYSQIPGSYKTFFTGKAEGYGVVRMKGDLPPDISVFDKDADNYKSLAGYRQQLYQTLTGNKITTDLGSPGGGFGDVDCDSGGSGALSCSITQGIHSCTVSCSRGSYACCSEGFTTPECTCIPIKTN